MASCNKADGKRLAADLYADEFRGNDPRRPARTADLGGHVGKGTGDPHRKHTQLYSGKAHAAKPADRLDLLRTLRTRHDKAARFRAQSS